MRILPIVIPGVPEYGFFCQLRQGGKERKVKNLVITSTRKHQVCNIMLNIFSMKPQKRHPVGKKKFPNWENIFFQLGTLNFPVGGNFPIYLPIGGIGLPTDNGTNILQNEEGEQNGYTQQPLYVYKKD